jgi:exosortase A-associated hydrolase 2
MLAGHAGQRFCLFHRPAAEAVMRGAIVYLHPFAEEMNKSRRMAGLGARALAGGGWAVLQIDMYGCGDSSGEFDDAAWQDWVGDALRAHAWMSGRFGPRSWLWGMRAGALIAAQAAHLLSPSPDLLFWQPVLSGQQHLAHFLRYRSADKMLSAAQGAAQPPATGQGDAQEVAGYRLSPALALGLESAQLEIPVACGRVVWCEVSLGPEQDLLPASHRYIARCRERGSLIRERVVSGPPFWQTVETTQCEALLDATVEMTCQ